MADSGWRGELRSLQPHLADMPVSEGAAITLGAHGRSAAAESAYRELLAREPHHLSALRALEIICKHRGLHDEADALGARALRAEAHWMGIPAAEQQQAADFFRAALGNSAVPATAPAAMVGAQFDRYAPWYEQHLADLAFRVPEVIAQALGPWMAERRPISACDVGCGTGLMGVRLKPYASLLDGIDLSAGMLDVARAKAVYDGLHPGDAATLLRQRPAAYDLIVASDALPYIGDVGALFAAAAAALRPGGRFACTAEDGGEVGYVLRQSRRFAHGRGYLRGCATSAGLEVIMLADTCGRLEGGEPMPMHLLVAQAGAP